MGEVSEMMLEGILCCDCGTFISEEACGYPVKCSDCEIKQEIKKHK